MVHRQCAPSRRSARRPQATQRRHKHGDALPTVHRSEHLAAIDSKLRPEVKRRRCRCSYVPDKLATCPAALERPAARPLLDRWTPVMRLKSPTARPLCIRARHRSAAAVRFLIARERCAPSPARGDNGRGPDHDASIVSRDRSTLGAKAIARPRNRTPDARRCGLSLRVLAASFFVRRRFAAVTARRRTSRCRLYRRSSHHTNE